MMCTSQLAQSNTQLLLNLVNIYRSLDGGWQLDNGIMADDNANQKWVF